MAFLPKIFENLPQSSKQCFYRSDPIRFFARLSHDTLRLTCVVPSLSRVDYLEVYTVNFTEDALRIFLSDDVGVEIEGNQEEETDALAQCFADALLGKIQFEQNKSRKRKTHIFIQLQFSIGDLEPVLHKLSMNYMEGGDIMIDIYDDLTASIQDTNSDTLLQKRSLSLKRSQEAEEEEERIALNKKQFIHGETSLSQFT
mmetsp:Transcript_34062/g.43940  ORF Transcript_34062/g.43940 Transcript_34062/m.43940 type:complete len:200 (-) Transcript_34062:241-840(-)